MLDRLRENDSEIRTKRLMVASFGEHWRYLCDADDVNLKDRIADEVIWYMEEADEESPSLELAFCIDYLTDREAREDY